MSLGKGAFNHGWEVLKASGKAISFKDVGRKVGRWDGNGWPRQWRWLPAWKCGGKRKGEAMGVQWTDTGEAEERSSDSINLWGFVYLLLNLLDISHISPQTYHRPTHIFCPVIKWIKKHYIEATMLERVWWCSRKKLNLELPNVPAFLLLATSPKEEVKLWCEQSLVHPS